MAKIWRVYKSSDMTGSVIRITIAITEPVPCRLIFIVCFKHVYRISISLPLKPFKWIYDPIASPARDPSGESSLDQIRSMHAQINAIIENERVFKYVREEEGCVP